MTRLPRISGGEAVKAFELLGWLAGCKFARAEAILFWCAKDCRLRCLVPITRN